MAGGGVGSRQFAPISHGHSARFTYICMFYFSLLSERSGRWTLPLERSALYSICFVRGIPLHMVHTTVDMCMVRATLQTAPHKSF